MASLLVKLVSSLTPPPFTQGEEYDGWEYRWKFLVFRPALFQTQAYLLVGLLAYVAFTLYGKYTNQKKANAWFAAHQETLEAQFSKPATSSGLIADGYTDFFNFSTGRRGIASLHTIFTLRPRQDLLQLIYQFAWQLYDLRYSPYDELVLDFKLPSDSTAPDCVWAVVSKEELFSIKNSRWDLTFTKTSDNAALPPSLSVMTEFADVTDNLFKPSDKLSLTKLLSDPVNLKYFRSLSVTDQPRERPALPLAPHEREKHVILCLSVPPASQAWETIALVASMFSFIDNLSKINLRPETKNKVRKVREEVDKEIREEAVKEKREEAAEDKKAAKRKAEQERISKLSAAEQKKILERDRKRAMKKSQGKVVRKG
ncbi:DUF1682-domain-containing protein [Hygrophoropsis aurantiaca]|uniref:DUF1682-domain-containing protein n=1 Tax=Hygrophoropsis aurantiaca TaxID=72124 RepID=A0ACB8ALR0_9AGAM|nr:DUF1682-domain-containing protein [Hygrophoropsis aurantiaca]